MNSIGRNTVQNIHEPVKPKILKRRAPDSASMKTHKIAKDSFDSKKRPAEPNMGSKRTGRLDDQTASLAASPKGNKLLKTESSHLFPEKNAIQPLLTALEIEFTQNADQALGLKQKKWMRDQFPFLGIATPERRKLQKAIFKQHLHAAKQMSEDDTIELIQSLWNKSHREFHYAAIDIAKSALKHYSPKMLSVFEKMIRTNPWWDTVDDIASNLIGNLIKKHPALLNQMDAWIQDEHLWIRRTALIFQLKWKKETDFKRLFDYCEKKMDEKEFFIQKAIGWALREYSKTDKRSVQEFLKKHRSALSPLSFAEASKHL